MRFANSAIRKASLLVPCVLALPFFFFQLYFVCSSRIRRNVSVHALSEKFVFFKVSLKLKVTTFWIQTLKKNLLYICSRITELTYYQRRTTQSYFYKIHKNKSDPNEASLKHYQPQAWANIFRTIVACIGADLTYAWIFYRHPKVRFAFPPASSSSSSSSRYRSSCGFNELSL